MRLDAEAGDALAVAAVSEVKILDVEWLPTEGLVIATVLDHPDGGSVARVRSKRMTLEELAALRRSVTGAPASVTPGAEIVTLESHRPATTAKGPSSGC